MRTKLTSRKSSRSFPPASLAESVLVDDNVIVRDISSVSDLRDISDPINATSWSTIVSAAKTLQAGNYKLKPGVYPFNSQYEEEHNDRFQPLGTPRTQSPPYDIVERVREEARLMLIAV